MKFSLPPMLDNLLNRFNEPSQTTVRNGHGTNALFSIPARVALGPAGILYAADRLNHVVRKMSQSGKVGVFAGAPGQSGFADGPSGIGRFNAPRAVATAPDGIVVIADTWNHRVCRLTKGLVGGKFDQPIRVGILSTSSENSFVPARDSRVWSWVRRPKGSDLELPK